MRQYDKLPDFCIEGCKLYKKDLERRKNEKVCERNSLIDKYTKFCKNAHIHFTQHNQPVEIDEKELKLLCDLIKDHFYKEYDLEYKKFDEEIAKVKRFIETEEAKIGDDD